ncbi:hypothetical protein FKP32DRAFT_1758422 [Trametes sanguinea]|nr:hypothetical protein FKP32DRAFT_1758422 [Trametes sanguinea]
MSERMNDLGLSYYRKLASSQSQQIEGLQEQVLGLTNQLSALETQLAAQNAYIAELEARSEHRANIRQVKEKTVKSDEGATIPDLHGRWARPPVVPSKNEEHKDIDNNLDQGSRLQGTRGLDAPVVDFSIGDWNPNDHVGSPPPIRPGTAAKTRGTPPSTKQPGEDATVRVKRERDDDAHAIASAKPAKRTFLVPEVVVPLPSRRMRSVSARARSASIRPSVQRSESVPQLRDGSSVPSLNGDDLYVMDDEDDPIMEGDDSTQIVKLEPGNGSGLSDLTDLAEEAEATWDAPFHQPWLEVEASGETPTIKAYFDARIRNVPAFPVRLAPSIRNVTVSRSFMSKNFGGQNRSMAITYSDQNRRDHGHSYANCLYTREVINWGVPRRPGDPGVLLIMVSQLWSPGPQKLFVWLDHSKWLYMGEYELTKTGYLSPQEFKLLPEKVRKKWGKILTVESKNRGLRARIFYHQEEGRVLDKEELAEKLRAAPENKYPLSAQEVIDAFDKGIIRIKSWSMKCIGYDQDFQRRIAELASTGKQMK